MTLSAKQQQIAEPKVPAEPGAPAQGDSESPAKLGRFELFLPFTFLITGVACAIVGQVISPEWPEGPIDRAWRLQTTFAEGMSLFGQVLMWTTLPIFWRLRFPGPVSRWDIVGAVMLVAGPILALVGFAMDIQAAARLSGEPSEGLSLLTQCGLFLAWSTPGIIFTGISGRSFATERIKNWRGIGLSEWELRQLRGGRAPDEPKDEEAGR